MAEPTRDEMIAALLEIAKTHGIVALIAVGMVYSLEFQTPHKRITRPRMLLAYHACDQFFRDTIPQMAPRLTPNILP